MEKEQLPALVAEMRTAPQSKGRGGVGGEGMGGIDDGVVELKVGGEGGDGGVDGGAGLDEEDDGTGTGEGEHKPARVAVAQDRERRVHLGGGAVVYGDREPFLGDVARGSGPWW
jgi:hypothetical protein